MNINNKILIGIGIIAGLLFVTGVVAFIILQPAEPTIEEANVILPEKPTAEEANVILAESIQNTLKLDSFTATGNGTLKIKDGEAILFEVAIEDGQASIINPFDFVEQDLSSVFTYNVLMNFSAIASFIEKISTSEELEELRAIGEMLGIDILTTMRALGEANISVTMEMKSIDFDTYMKIVEIKGLREIITDVAGVFVAEMAMGEMEAGLGIWQKTPAEPIIIEEMTTMFEGIQAMILPMFNTYYVKEVLPNTQVERSVKGEDLSSSLTKVNGTPVYNFVLAINLDKMKDVVIASISLFAEFAEEEITIEEKEKIIAGINKNWPEIVKVVEAMELDAASYICQETRFFVKEWQTVNINLYEFITVLEPIMREVEVEVTPEEEAELARMKQAVKNMSIVGTMNVVYSDHNAVPAIVPPAEYEVIEVPPISPYPPTIFPMP